MTFHSNFGFNNIINHFNITYKLPCDFCRPNPTSCRSDAVDRNSCFEPENQQNPETPRPGNEFRRLPDKEPDAADHRSAGIPKALPDTLRVYYLSFYKRAPRTALRELWPRQDRHSLRCSRGPPSVPTR